MLDVAIVGVGLWGRRLIESVQGSSDAIRFTTAVARTPSKIEQFASEHGVRVTNDLSTVLDDPLVRGVVICGPSGLHAAQAMAALEAGKPVMVIKPLALVRTDAEMLRQAAASRGLVLAMGYDRRFMPAVDELYRRVRAGDLGRLLHAEGAFCVNRHTILQPGDWKTDPAQSAPGSMADHMLYMMIELFGPVAEVYARGDSQVIEFDVADTASVMLRFHSGATGLLTGIGVTSDFHRLHVFGTGGWSEIRGKNRFQYHEYNPHEGASTVTEYPAVDALKRQMECFAAAVAGEIDFPVSPEDAVHGVAALEAMTVSGATGKPVTL